MYSFAHPQVAQHLSKILYKLSSMATCTNTALAGSANSGGGCKIDRNAGKSTFLTKADAIVVIGLLGPASSLSPLPVLDPFLSVAAESRLKSNTRTTSGEAKSCDLLS
jgi:hypothetical protein